MTSVLLATWAGMPDGEPEGQLLTAAFAALGARARWVAWDDPAVDWAAADLVAVRATWDYAGRLEEFLAWARSLGPRLLNGAEVFAWNTDKRYLLALAEVGIPVVPTLVVEREDDLPAAVAAYDVAVVKPVVGAGGRGVIVVDGPDRPDRDGLPPGPWIVQPLVESVRTAGELSVHVLGGEPVSAVRKLPGAGEIRVHPTYGGRSEVVDLDPGVADLARRTVTAAARLLDQPLPYARVDLLRMADGTPSVNELEITEPGLYLDLVPANAARFAAAALR